MSTLGPLVAEAISLGANGLDVECRGGHEEVAAIRGQLGTTIARLRSASAEARELRRELYALARKRRRMTVGELEYELRAQVRDSFGEDAFRVQIRRINVHSLERTLRQRTAGDEEVG